MKTRKWWTSDRLYISKAACIRAKACITLKQSWNWNFFPFSLFHPRYHSIKDDDNTVQSFVAIRLFVFYDDIIESSTLSTQFSVALWCKFFKKLIPIYFMRCGLLWSLRWCSCARPGILGSSSAKCLLRRGNGYTMNQSWDQLFNWINSFCFFSFLVL